MKRKSRKVSLRYGTGFTQESRNRIIGETAETSRNFKIMKIDLEVIIQIIEQPKWFEGQNEKFI